MSRARGQQGRFSHKSEGDRQVRSLRVTDLVWQAFGKYAEEQGMTRADLLEQLVQQWEQQHSHPQAVDAELVEPVVPARLASTEKPVAATSKARYYLQLAYTSYTNKGARRSQWYWDGSELIPKGVPHPSQRAKVYSSKAGALSAAKRLQPHVDQFAARVKQPAALLSLKPVRVTW